MLSCSTQLSVKFLMLISIKYIKKFSIFSGADKPRMLVFLLINVKIPNVLAF